MLEELVKQGHVRAWHQGTIFGPHLEGYLDAVAAQGFAPVRLRGKLCAVTWFGEHLRHQGVQTIAGITEAHAMSFLAASEKGRLAARRQAVKDLLRYLQEQRAWAPLPQREVTGPIEDYLRSLSEERGLQPSSISNHRHNVNRFLRQVGCDTARESLAGLTVKDVDRAIVGVGRHYSRSGMSQFCSSIRGLLRYLYGAGILSSDISSGVIAPRRYALERLPCALPWETVKRIFGAVDTTRRRGRRDLAILWLLVAYGLRSGEVEHLRLKDIDWRRDLIHVRRSKPGRPLRLPLTREVGDAILAYLKDGRPKTKSPEVFIRVNAPYTPLRESVGSNVVTRYLRKAGIESRRSGAYLIRHSFAVHLVRQGEPLKTITDLLGHADPRTAFHYTKLALEDLQDVALPAADVLP